MTRVIKFPDMRPPSRGGPIPELPNPAQYRQTTPAVIAQEMRATAPRIERKRLLVWFSVAVGLHAALLIAIWLTPPLRLKWSPSPDAWVPVVSLPVPPPAPVAPTPVVPTPSAAATPVGAQSKPPKSAHSKSAAQRAPAVEPPLADPPLGRAH
jgi:hypothetical protein